MQGKLAASYWLGLIQYDAGEYRCGLDYFSVRTLAVRLDGLSGPPAPITTSPAPWKPADSGKRRSRNTSPLHCCGTTRETFFVPAG